MNQFLPKPSKWYIRETGLQCYIGPFESEEKAKEVRRAQFNNGDHADIIEMVTDLEQAESVLEEMLRYSKPMK